MKRHQVKGVNLKKNIHFWSILTNVLAPLVLSGLEYLEDKASLLKTEGEGPTEGILNSSKGSTLSTISISSLSMSMSPFGNSAWDNLGDTSKLEGSI